MCSRQIATQASASSARTLTLLRLRYQQQPTLRLHHSHTCNTRFFSPSSSSSYSALLSRFSAPSTFTCLQKSPLLTTSRNMFHRAVQEHAQSRPPSIPQRDKNRLSINGFLRGSGRASTTAATALQASAQTTLNTNRPTKPSSAATPSSVPKRPLSSGLASLYNATTAFEENVPRPIDIMPPTSMQALHDAVYFVDSDFDNDSDLDFDISEPIINPSLAAAARMLPSPPDSLKSQSPQPTMQQPSTHRPKDTFDDLEFEPRLPNPAPNPTVQNVIDSSQPFQWSSSPAEHFEPPKRRSDPVEEEAPPPKRKKARAIPWAKKPEAVQEVKKAASKVGPARRTPSDSMPWNESFSNVEAGKKETRKRNAAKRSLTTLATDSELSRKVTKGREPIAPIFLTEEQQRVADLVANHGQSVFFTGSAGTGKSVLLRQLITELKKRHRKDPDAVAVTASTGLAACNIGGVTLHSFAGIGLGKESVQDLARKIKRNQKAKNRWIRTKILIMDEISMVDGDLFDKLEAIARQIRNNGKVFGGIQLVITGDFFQLPPVPEGGKVAKFAFDANSWNTSIKHTIGLTQVFRQRDPEFAEMLNEMRIGKLTSRTIEIFKGLNRDIKYNDGISATELFSTRKEVDSANNQKMRALPGEAKRFTAVDSGTIQDPQVRAKLLSSCMAPAVIDLKINSQVMLIKNVDDSLVNGSLGRVVGFMSEKSFDMWSEEGNTVLEGLEEDETMKPGSKGAIDTGHRWPLVQFALMDGTSRQLLCQPEQWKVELPNGEVQAARSQIPLILAWALSIHKAQGQTLERVKVDLGRVFEKGQAYVALSRATCKEGLQVMRFDEKKVMAHEKVMKFYASLYSAAEAAAAAGRSSSLKSLAPMKRQQLPQPSKESDWGDQDYDDQRAAEAGVW